RRRGAEAARDQPRGECGVIRIGYIAIAAGLSVLAAAPTAAQQGESDEFDIEFQTHVSTPDVLDPVIVPYVDCMMSISGAAHLDWQGNKLEPPTVSTDCAVERTAVLSRGSQLLAQAGVEEDWAQEDILRKSLFAVDLMAWGNRAWLEGPDDARE